MYIGDIKQAKSDWKVKNETKMKQTGKLSAHPKSSKLFFPISQKADPSRSS